MFFSSSHIAILIMFHLFFLFDYYIGNYIKISEADSANGQFNSASGQKIAKVILSAQDMCSNQIA